MRYETDNATPQIETINAIEHGRLSVTDVGVMCKNKYPLAWEEADQFPNEILRKGLWNYNSTNKNRHKM